VFVSVQIVGSAQDSVTGERWRTCGPGLGVKGPQVQILSSRRETAGQRPFRTKSEAASLLPCSHWCSHGTRSHQPIAAENCWTAKRAPWLATWPCASPVTATGECPSSSETVCRGTPAASMSLANQCLSVCIPTPIMPKALAAVLLARSALLGFDCRPLSVVKSRPARVDPFECLAVLTLSPQVVLPGALIPDELHSARSRSTPSPSSSRLIEVSGRRAFAGGRCVGLSVKQCCTSSWICPSFTCAGWETRPTGANVE